MTPKRWQEILDSSDMYLPVIGYTLTRYVPPVPQYLSCLPYVIDPLCTYLFPQKSSSSIFNGIPQPSSSYVSYEYIKPDAISRVLQFTSINFQYRLPQIYLNTVTIIFCSGPASLPGKFHYTSISADSAPTFIISTEVYSHQHSHQEIPHKPSFPAR